MVVLGEGSRAGYLSAQLTNTSQSYVIKLFSSSFSSRRKVSLHVLLNESETRRNISRLILVKFISVYALSEIIRETKKEEVRE